MKKKLIYFGFVLFSLFFLVGCTKNNLGEESEFGEEVNNLEDVSIELIDDTYKSEGDTFELKVINHSEEEVSYGVEYALEYCDGDTWYEVEPNEEPAFILILHMLKAGEEDIEELNLEFYEPLEAGHYRIIRQINNEPLAAEFDVEK